MRSHQADAAEPAPWRSMAAAATMIHSLIPEAIENSSAWFELFARDNCQPRSEKCVA
jgi:hypothetical protein